MKVCLCEIGEEKIPCQLQDLRMHRMKISTSSAWQNDDN